MMSVIGPMKKFDPLPILFQSIPIKSEPIETESEKNGTRLISIGMTRWRYLDAFPKTTSILLSLNLPLKPSSLENSQVPKILEQICPAERPIVLTGPKLKTTMPCASLAGLR